MKNKQFEQILAEGLNPYSEESRTRVREYMDSLEEGAKFQPNLDEFKKQIRGITPRKYWKQMNIHDYLISQAVGKTVLINTTQGDSTKLLPRDLEQRYKEYNDKLDKIILDIQELKRVLNPPIALDLSNPIHVLHKQIIDEHPIEHGQRYQAIDRDGTVNRYSSEPYLGMVMGEWNYNGPIWGIDDVQLNGINWRDTLIKL